MILTNFDPIKYAIPAGPQLTCKGWIQEAALRMLLNNLNPKVAGHYDELIAYSEKDKVPGNLEAVDDIITALKSLENHETLLIQDGKAFGIMKTHKDAPRVLISNSPNLSGPPKWQHLEGLDKIGLMMFSEMSAGSWIYVGNQGIVQENYETYASIAEKYFNGTLKGTLNVTAGLGSMGCVQPLAITMNEGVALIAEVEVWRIDKCISSKYLDLKVSDIDNAIDLALEAKSAGNVISIGVLCNVVRLLERLVQRNIIPDTITDQTSAHDPLMGYWAHEMSYEYSKVLRLQNPKQYIDSACKSMYRHMQLMLELQNKGATTFDYGNSIRARAKECGLKHAFNFPGFIPSYIRPLFSESKGPFRWAALSGDLNDVAITDKLIMNMFPQNKGLMQWMKSTRQKIICQGLPARICWLGQDEREEAGLAFNELVRKEKVKAPIVISRDHLNTFSTASCRTTETIMEGGDITDWPILSALVNTAAGASWVSLEYCGDAGINRSILAGMVIVADGTEEAALRLSRVLRNDPCIGIIRPVDTGIKIVPQPPKKYKLNFKDRLSYNKAEAW